MKRVGTERLQSPLRQSLQQSAVRAALTPHAAAPAGSRGHAGTRAARVPLPGRARMRRKTHAAGRRTRACLALVLVVACAGGEPGVLTPLLTPADSVQLRGADDAWFGTGAALTVAADGSFLVSDPAGYTVHHFAADGRHVRSLGQRGSGPGEFTGPPGALAVDGDSLVFVIVQPAHLQTIDYRTGEFTARRNLQSYGVPAIAVSNGRVLYKRLDVDRRTTVGMLTAGSDSVHNGGPFPGPLDEHPFHADPALSMLVVAPIDGGDRIALALQSTDWIFLGRFAPGSPYDSVHVPVLYRQGARRDVMERAIADPTSVGAEIYTPTQPWLIALLTDGTLAYLGADLTLLDDRFAGVLHLSVIDVDGRRACPDARVDTPADAWPLATVRADTLFVLIRVIAGNDLRAGIRKYVISTAGCRWSESPADD